MLINLIRLYLLIKKNPAVRYQCQISKNILLALQDHIYGLYRIFEQHGIAFLYILNKTKIFKIYCIIFIFTIFLFDCGQKSSYTVVIDPGHGGVQTGKPDDKWDVVKKRFVGSFLPGMKVKVNGRVIYEHIVVLELSKRVKYYLELVNSDEGWIEFIDILKRFSDQKSFRRIKFNVHLSRENSWNHVYKSPKQAGVNSNYRLYDYPDPITGQMQKGRISFINSFKPELVVSIHTNPAGKGHPGGMATVLAPPYSMFDKIRKIHLNKEGIETYNNSPWSRAWLITDPGWNSFEAARADTWVYFHGYRSNKNGTAVNTKKYRGLRHNMFQWAYAQKKGWEKNYTPDKPGKYSLVYENFKEQGPFWDREKSKYEAMRRQAGRLGYGGDNHTASDELLRFVQYGARALNQDLDHKESIGTIQPPYASTYSLPTFSNAIVAYLEIAYLNRKKDRNLIINHKEEVAQSLAVGIYSLFCGLRLRPKSYNDKPPSGLTLDLEKYGNYFEDVVED